MEWNNSKAKYLYKYLKDMIKENDWDNEYTRNWARSFMTTICILEGIDVDTKEWDDLIEELFNECGIADVYNWEEIDRFNLFMGEYLA